MPKSKGRKRKGKVSRQRRQPSLVDEVVRDALSMDVDEPLLAWELWASGWLGAAWGLAELSDREPEEALCRKVVDQVKSIQSGRGVAAVAALGRVAPVGVLPFLEETVNGLSASRDRPLWSAGVGWTATAAYRATDVWDSQSHLIVEFDGPDPHALVVQVTRVGGDMVQTMMVSDQDVAAQWDSLVNSLGGEQPPLPLIAAEPADVLAELAELMRITDTYWPRTEDDDFRELRALVWSRCRDHASDEWPEFVELTDRERDEIVDAFVAGGGRGDDVGRALAYRFLDYGEGYLRSSPFAWSPDEVGLFLSDWLPRKATLRADERDALLDVLEEWLAFALTRRGVEQRWIEPVVDAVAEFAPDFEDAFDDESAWGPSKEVATALLERGVDLNDPEALEAALSAYNAERLAERLLQPGDRD